MKAPAFARVLVLGLVLPLLLISGCASHEDARFDNPVGMAPDSAPLLAPPGDAAAAVGSAPPPITKAYAWTHDNITDQAFEEAWNLVKGGLSPAPACPDQVRDVLLDIVAQANLDQDSGAAANDLRRHYNRPLVSNETVAMKLAADASYAAYLAAEDRTVATEIAAGAIDGNPIGHANLALQAAGRLLHSFQDFYFHGIRRDGAGGSEFNLRAGFKAWTGSPVQTGDPTHRGFFFPCSWGSIWKPGEHGYGEPVGTGTAEKEARFRAARITCRTWLVPFLQAWWAAYGRVYAF